MFDEIKKALADKPELLVVLNSAEKTIQDNVEKINHLESETKKLIDQRQELKQTIRETLGVSEVSKEALEKIAKGHDEALKADNAALQEKLAEMEAQLGEVEGKYERKIDTMLLKDTLRASGVDQSVANSLAFEQLTEQLLANAKRDENGAFVFVKEDGSTEFNRAGKPKTVEEKVKELQSSDYAFLFKPKAGGGANLTEDQPVTTGEAPAISEGTKYVLETLAS